MHARARTRPPVKQPRLFSTIPHRWDTASYYICLMS
jgi:hypothetical protein